MFGDDVVGGAAADAAGVDTGCALGVPGYRIEVLDRRRHRLDRVRARLGAGSGVGRLARELGAELRDGQKVVDAGDDLSGGVIEADVERQQVVDVIDDAGFGHRFAARNLFLAGLEDQFKCASEIAGEDRIQDAEADGGVGIVAAGVHIALVLGAEPLAGWLVVGIVGFGDREGVDIDPEGNRWAGAAVDDRDRAGEALADCC